MKNSLINIQEYFFLFLCIISTWVLAGAIPYFDLDGMYWQVDTQILFLHSFCSILCFIQTLKIIFNKNEIYRLNNSLILIPMALVFLGLLSTIFSDNKIVTLMGSQQIGQGVFWYIDLSIMTLVFSSILHKKSFRIIVLINLILLNTIAAIFTLNPGWKNIPISFFYYPDYLCFFGVLTFVFMTTVTSNRYIILAGYLCLGIYLQYLENNAAIMLWVCALLFGILINILDFFKEKYFFNKVKVFLISSEVFTFIVSLLSLLILILALIYWRGTGGLDIETSISPLVSAIVRGKIAEIAMSSLFDFKNFFFGTGWGRVNDLLLMNMNTWQYDQLTVGFNLHFHTHNELFEHFISLGIFGLILFLLFIYKVFDKSDSVNAYTKIGWLLFFLISCFWFFWAGTLPLIAVALASLIALENKKEKAPVFLRLRGIRYITLLITFSAGIFLIYGAWLQYYYTKEFKKISYGAISKLVLKQSLDNIVCEGYYDDKRGGFTLIPFMNGFPDYIISNQMPFQEQDLKVIEGVQCLALSNIRKGIASLDLISASVLLDSKLYFSGNEDAKNLFNYKKKYSQLKERSIELVNIAPKRGDLIVPFISLAMEKQKFDDAMFFCKNKDIKGLESICHLVTAAYLLKSEEVSAEEISKSIEHLDLAKQKGLYTEKVYGWWYSEEASKVSGYNPDYGTPLSANVIYLISNTEIKNIEVLLGNLE